MQAILLYLLKSVVCLAILMLYYHIALRNKRFHYYNRFYLLMAVVLSLVLPLLHLEWWQVNSNNKQVIRLANIVWVNDGADAADGTSTFVWDTTNIALIISIAITLFLTASVIYKVVTLYRIKRKFPVSKMEQIDFVNTDLEQAPFSFFQNLFWRNNIDITEETGRQILRHELTHIQQKHSWDKLFMKITTAIFWMNPFYWMIQKELSLVHEFIADEKAVQDKSADAFARMLLHQQYGKSVFSPAQSFNYSPIKRRLLMLTTSTKSSYSYARRLMVLPLLIATVFLFAFTLKNNETFTINIHTNAPFVLVVDAGHGGKDAGAIGINNTQEKDINLAVAKEIEELAPEYGVTVKMTRIADVAVDVKQRVEFAIEQKADAFLSLHVNSTSAGIADKVRGVEVCIPKQEEKENFRPSQLFASSLLRNLETNFTTKPELVQNKQQGVWVLDGNPYPAALVHCGYMTNTEDVKLLTNKANVEKMARDILSGVVAYANADKDFKDFADNDTVTLKATRIELRSSDTAKKPIYIVDGKELSDKVAQALDPNKISEVNVIKGAQATQQYGERAKNGVVVIKLKEDSIKMGVKIEKPFVIIRDSAKGTGAPLYIVDGKEISKAEMDNIKPNDIESINVLKNESATKIYGDKGKNGVVEITIKKLTSSEAVIEEKKSSDFLLSIQDPPTTQAKFPGGDKAWNSYLARQLNSNTPGKNGAPMGNYTAVISFIVDVNGNISNIKTQSDPGYGAAEEAVRVIKSGPKWIPATKNGKNIESTYVKGISFVVTVNSK